MKNQSVQNVFVGRISAIVDKRKKVIMIHSASLCRLDPILQELSLEYRLQVGYELWCTDEK